MEKEKSYAPLVIILVLILLVAGGVFFYLTSDSAPENEQALNLGDSGADTIIAEDETVVSYDGTNFFPGIITVQSGESVTFVNESNGEMSVASNPHPTHTDYPEFDQYKSPERGQKSYTFVFSENGSWGYHNHLSPSAVGTVVVIPSK